MTRRRPPAPRRPARAALLALAAASALFGASCAPRLALPPRLDVSDVRARYVRALLARESLARGVDADLRLWFEGDAVANFPAVHGTLALGSPDAFRVRVESLFGTALDLAARGDSVTAWVPPERLGLALDARADSLAIPMPGTLGALVFGAMWRPPDSAWSEARWEDSLLVVTWMESGGAVRVGVGASGLPRTVRVQNDRGSDVIASYLGWDWIDGAAWPSRFVAGDAAGRARVTCGLSRLRSRPGRDPSRFSLRFPPTARIMDWPALRRRIERWSGL